MDTTPDLVHEETGMFLFNMQDGTITRHGIIPHGLRLISLIDAIRLYLCDEGISHVGRRESPSNSKNEDYPTYGT